MANELSNLTVAQLKRALELKERIDALENEISQILGEPNSAPRPAASAQPGRKILSAAARAKAAAYQRERRARLKAAA